MKGSITVYLAMTLSCLTGFLLLLTGNAINNANRIRMEGAVDISMNSALGEFHKVLHERYGLLYIDLSYESGEPTVTNLEKRLMFYAEQNTNTQKKNSPWGSFKIKTFEIVNVNRATENYGKSMIQQAINYRNDCGKETEVVFGEAAERICVKDNKCTMKNWSDLMKLIEQKKLPVIIDDYGNKKEIDINNPAKGVFAMTDSDLLWLCGVDISKIGVGIIKKESFCSQKEEGKINTEVIAKENIPIFVEYLFGKMGNYGREKKDGFLQFQLEYIAMGKKSDYENLKAVIETIFSYRFSENAKYVFSDAGLYHQALTIAETLPVVAYDGSFREPIAKSLLYANAYLETLAEMRCLLAGGSIQKIKNGWSTDWQQVEEAMVRQIDNTADGYSYEEYLFCLILQLAQNIRSWRSMDIMEMDIRYLTGDISFSMAGCVERFTACIKAEDDKGKQIFLTRTYGYY